MTKRAEKWAIAYARAVVRWRWLVIFLVLAASAAAIAGAGRLAFTSDYRVFFGASNPQLQAFEALQNIYTRSDNILFVLKPAEGTVFTPKRLAAIAELTEESWQIPNSTRVDSITNFQNTTAEGDDLTVADLVENPLSLTDDDLAYIEKTALSEPALARRLISEDGTTTAVAITLLLPPGDDKALMDTVQAAERIAATFTARYPEFRLAVTGLAPLSAAFQRASMGDMQFLIPVMFLVIVMAILAFLRSVPGTAVTILITALSAMSAMGLAGWAGIRLTPPSASAPIIILTIAIADCVHLLVTMFHEMRQGRSKHEAIVESLRINIQPVFLTSLTTIIGFLSMNFSDAPPFHDLGNISAAGVFVAWVLAMTLLPAAMAVLPVRIPRGGSGRIHAMERLADFVIARRNALLIGIGAVSAAMISAISLIQLDDRFVEYFDRSIPFRVDTDFARENLAGIYQVEFSVPAEGSGGISDPAYLDKIEEFANWLRAQPGVTHVNVISDVMKRINKSMHGDDESFYRLPEERDLAAQYLLLYELSLPYGLDLNSQINVDKSASRLTVTLDDVKTSEMRALARRAEAWLKRNAPPYMAAEGTGASIMFAYISERNIRSMLLGTLIAFLLISASMVIALRSIRMGLISLIPNMIPAAIAFGIWGIFVGQVGIAVSVVAASSMGLIVDASVHFLSKYLRARREKNLPPEDAVRYSFSTVGTALWVTTAILTAGFGVLAFSSFAVNGDMGLLMAITIVVALIVDFLLLPPLLLLFESRKATAAVRRQPAE